MTAPALVYVNANGIPVAVIPLAGGKLPVSALTKWDGTPFDLDALATGAKQDAAQSTLDDQLTALQAIAAALVGVLDIGGTVAVSNFPTTQPISVASLPLPSGAATDTTATAAKGVLDAILSALPALVSGRTPVQIGADGVGLARESGGVLATISSTLASALSKLTEIDSDSLQQTTYLATLAGIVTGGRALVTEASAAGILAALTSGSQISQIGASAASAGAWTVARYGAATGATSLGSGTVMVKASAGRVRSVYVSNKSGGVIWCGVSDRATALSNGAVPDYDVALANGAGNRTFDGGETGTVFANGLCLSFSKTQQATDSTTVVSNITVIVNYA